MFGQWERVTLLDLEQHWRIDAYDLDTVDRPWRWFRARIVGLLDIPESRLAASLSRR